ncbi:MarR family winged helix-turn-helix transcriptional regulator [Paraferrimonas sp. SM1919]|uniref:MarR family winged helix-turn-helix transcriptional regulator n=1 Tax=Paraferrimonas sp. SM1919 TaxID=2662263 RepID=UPI0013D3FA1A|nr:MarR family transcriptional regulator [Paraferrimonas sp. SM1919]
MVQEWTLQQQLSALNELFQTQMDNNLKRYQLEFRFWPVLNQLWQAEGMTQIELAKTCDIPSYTITRVLDHLQTLGFIERRQEPENRRVFRIFLTIEGKAIKQDLMVEVERVEQELLNRLAPQQQALLKNLLQQLIN